MLQRNHSYFVGSRDSAGVAYRHPVLAQSDRLSGIEKCICFLITEDACLYLNVRAVIVGESLSPAEPLGIRTPGPYLLRRQIAVFGVVHYSRLRMWIPDAHERLATSMYKVRNRAAQLIPDDTQVGSLGPNRPATNFGEPVRRRKAHGVLDLRVVPNLDGGIVPPVVAMAYIAAVIKGNALFEQSGSWAHDQLDSPLHAIDSIDIANGHRGTAVRLSRV